METQTEIIVCTYYTHLQIHFKANRPTSQILEHDIVSHFSRFLFHTLTHTDRPDGDSQCKVLLWVAAVPQQPCPQLHADDAEDKEDEEAEEEDVTQHG